MLISLLKTDELKMKLDELPLDTNMKIHLLINNIS